MEEALVFIGLGETGKKVDPFSPYTLLIEDPSGAFSDERLQGELLTFYQDFKAKGATRVRYIILFPLDETFTVSFQDVYKSIAGLHQDAILLPFEAEAFILLPPLKSNPSTKARCYRLFKALEAAPMQEVPDLVWLLDTDRLPNRRMNDLFHLYLSTDTYRSFNAQAETKADRETEQRYSSLGISRLIFSAKEWHENLSLRLVRDLLDVRALSPFQVELQLAKIALSQVLPFLKDKFCNIEENLRQSATFSQSDVLLEGLAVDEEERLEKFLIRLRLLIDQEISKRWTEMGGDTGIFCEGVKKEFHRILDESPHGVYSAWGFIGLLIASGGPYIDFFKALDPLPEDIKGISVQAFLFGWQEKNPSPALDLLFREVIKELRQFYSSRLLPFPELTTWIDLLGELSRLLEIEGIDKILGKGRIFIESLKEKVEVVVRAYQEPFSSQTTGKDLEDVLELLEGRARDYLKGIIEEVTPVRKEFEELESKIAILGWKKYLPFFWPILFKLWAKKAEFENAKMRLKEGYLQIFERRKNLFPCYFAPVVAEKLIEKIEPLNQEIKAFITLSNENRSLISQKIDGFDFSLPAFGFHVVEDEEEMKSLYHSRFSPQDIPNLYDEFIHSFKKTGEATPALSMFYTPAEKRKLFIDGLYVFSSSLFNWILNWDVGKVTTFLKKESKAASSLAKRSIPLLQVKEPTREDLQGALFVGVRDRNNNPLSTSTFSGLPPYFFSHKDSEEIIGLRISHGFLASSIESWEHWRKCHEQEETKKVHDRI